MGDRNALRFLWYGSSGHVTTYRMTSHVFGGVWCSSAATYAMRRVIEDHECDPAVANVIMNSFYVDDCLLSMDDRDFVADCLLQVKSTLQTGGFRLTKMIGNDDSIVQKIPDEDKAAEIKGLVHCDGKALGIQWDIGKDELYFSGDVKLADVVTRRSMLSVLSSTFDPLGLLGPILIGGKVIFQDATRLTLTWDEEVPDDVKSRWTSWFSTMKCLGQMRFPRCIKVERSQDSYLQLHHFSDASSRAYGCCSYLRSVSKSGKIQVELLLSKAKVAPMNATSIPRLELQAAVLSAKMDALLRRELDIEISKSFFWVDSMIALQYIQNESRRFHVFVSNRVSTIHELTKVEDWSHIPGCDNPADLVTRGVSVSQLDQLKWLHGPPFLSTFMDSWPVSAECPSLSADDAEVKKGNSLPSHTFVFMNDVSPNPIDTLIQHYSSWYRLKRAVSWWVRLKNVLRNKEHSTSGPLSVAEIEGAELLLLKHVQSQVYGKEIKALASGESVSRNSHLRSLNPLLDDDGMLCVGGRFQLLSGKQAYPYLVPHTHRIAEVIVRDVHENTAHVGLEWTLGKLRTKYWIVKARPLIKRVLRLCVPCKLMFGKSQTQKMADLPPERLVPDQPPFTFVGLDCFGPFLVKYRRSEVKRYGCVYTCFTTRAVHLEKLENLDTDSFLNSFRRFCARRGKPVKVWSDRGTNFVGGYNELLKALDKSQIVSYCAKQSIDWHFNPPHSSHMGGLWERVIRTIRKVLQGVLRNTSLTDDSLLTLFCEVESIVNSRPITKISDDITDSAALTPNHLLLLREGPVPPPGVFRSDDVYRRRWKHIQFLSDQFWRKWIREYIPELQKRHKWTDVQRNIKVGDIVLIADENTPRSLWPLGLVIEAIAGRDGLVRSVKVRTRTSQFVRPITKIVFIEGGSL